MKVKTRNLHLQGDLDQRATSGQACKQSASGYAPVGKCMSSLVGIKSINNTLVQHSVQYGIDYATYAVAKACIAATAQWNRHAQKISHKAQPAEGSSY